MSYDFPIDIYLLSTSKEESFAENIDGKIFMGLKSFLKKHEFGQFGQIILSEEGVHSIRLFESIK